MDLYRFVAPRVLRCERIYRPVAPAIGDSAGGVVTFPLCRGSSRGESRSPRPG